MKRKTLIVANWKMNHGLSQSIKFFTQLNRLVIPLEKVDVVVCPPFTSLYTSSVALSELNLSLGAQNCHPEDSGPYTGEVSPAFLEELGCTHVIVGHSERRQHFGETNSFIHKKVLSVLKHRLQPILCVGESLAEREAGQVNAVLEKQISECLLEVDREDLERVVVAYEPIWAIGTGKTATANEAQEAQSFIRQCLGRKFGSAYAISVRILYGGSVTAENISSLTIQNDINGALVGGASLSAESFQEILVNAN